MSKYYLSLEKLARQRGNVDMAIKQLVAEQQKSRFGFPEYWQTDYTLEEFCQKYESDFLARTPEDGREELQSFLNTEKEQPQNRMLEEKELIAGKTKLVARKILWRAFRSIGFPGTKSKADPDAIHNGCLLCLPNTAKTQQGIRLDSPDGSVNHVVLMNPFPILTDQVTIASLHHEPQELTARHISFILHLLTRSAEFKYSFNGIGAGESIPDHFHYYGFIGGLPIEKAGETARTFERYHLRIGQLDRDWPVIAFVIIGDRNRIGSLLLDLAGHLRQSRLSANVLFTRGKASEAKVYVIPRRKSRPQPDMGFKNDFGVVEMSGMLVCESSREYESADAGKAVKAMKQVGYPNTESVRAGLLSDFFGIG